MMNSLLFMFGILAVSAWIGTFINLRRLNRGILDTAILTTTTPPFAVIFLVQRLSAVWNDPEVESLALWRRCVFIFMLFLLVLPNVILSLADNATNETKIELSREIKSTSSSIVRQVWSRKTSNRVKWN